MQMSEHETRKNFRNTLQHSNFPAKATIYVKP